MNRENIKRVRDHIAGLGPKKFDLSHWIFNRRSKLDEFDYRGAGFTNARAVEGSCKTAACIAGHTLAVLAPTAKVPTDIADAAGELLGLPYATAHTLFLPLEGNALTSAAPDVLPGDLRREDVTAAQAVRVLDHLLETGKVDWSVALSLAEGKPGLGVGNE